MAANTKQISIEELTNKQTIPVFAKDNESTISHHEFIETLTYVTDQTYGGEQILKPAVSVSHPIKGRIPSAAGKPAKELQERENAVLRAYGLCYRGAFHQWRYSRKWP